MIKFYVWTKTSKEKGLSLLELIIVFVVISLLSLLIIIPISQQLKKNQRCPKET